MCEDQHPVVLVHGWNSHPGVWNRLVPPLERASLPFWRFDHSAMAGVDLAGRAAALEMYVDEMRDRTGYGGPLDVVCHSIGACIVRQWLEVADGAARKAQVRQLIMLGPPNNGSALAELFSDPVRGPEVIDLLAGVFVPPSFDPYADPLVQDVRPGSPTMRALRAVGIRDDIAYRVIVAGNPAAVEEFFPWFGGRTWELDGGGRYRQTLHGDGVVANAESALPGVPLEALAPGQDGDGRQIAPHHFCHIQLPRNPAVIDRVMECLIDPRSKGQTASSSSS
jgi:triacylglycerol lipase